MKRERDAAEAGCGWLSPGELVDFLEGRLAVRRRKAFLRHAVECPECGLLVDDVREWEGAVKVGPSAAEEVLFRRFGRPPAGARYRAAKRRLGLLAAAACLACALLLAPRSPGPAGIVGPVEVPPFLPPPVTRGGGANVDWERAEAAWRAGRYRLAATILEEGWDEGRVDRQAAFQAGLSRLLAGQPRRGLHLLDAACAPGPLTDACAWWLAVARDRAGDREGACQALEEVRRIGGEHAPEADRLLRARCRTRVGYRENSDGTDFPSAR